MNFWKRWLYRRSLGRQIAQALERYPNDAFLQAAADPALRGEEL